MLIWLTTLLIQFLFSLSIEGDVRYIVATFAFFEILIEISALAISLLIFSFTWIADRT